MAKNFLPDGFDEVYHIRFNIILITSLFLLTNYTQACSPRTEETVKIYPSLLIRDFGKTKRSSNLSHRRADNSGGLLKYLLEQEKTKQLELKLKLQELQSVQASSGAVNLEPVVGGVGMQIDTPPSLSRPRLNMLTAVGPANPDINAKKMGGEDQSARKTFLLGIVVGVTLTAGVAYLNPDLLRASKSV